MYVIFGERWIQVLCPFCVLFVFLLLSCINYIFWVLTPYPICGLQIFLLFCNEKVAFYWLFILLCRSFLIWYSLICWFLLLLLVLLVSYPKNNCQDWVKEFFLPYVFFYMFMASGLRFKSLIRFVFIFVYGVRECSNFTLLHAAVQFSQHHLLKRLSFLCCIFLPSLSKIRWPYVRGFISGLSILFHLSIFLFLWQYHTVF